MLVALGFCAESGVLLAQIRVAHIVEGVSVSDAKTLQVRKSHSLTQDHLARDTVVTNSFVTGGQILWKPQARAWMPAAYLWSEIMHRKLE